MYVTYNDSGRYSEAQTLMNSRCKIFFRKPLKHVHAHLNLQRMAITSPAQTNLESYPNTQARQQETIRVTKICFNILPTFMKSESNAAFAYGYGRDLFKRSLESVYSFIVCGYSVFSQGMKQ